MSSVMCWNIQSIKSRKNLGLLRSVIYFLCCEIELFIHSSIERKQTITDHCIKYCKALDITNNSQIWGTSILIKNGSKIELWSRIAGVGLTLFLYLNVKKYDETVIYRLLYMPIGKNVGATFRFKR